MFYDIFLTLCKQKGVTPSAVMRTIGLNKSSASYWKKGVTPSSDTLRKLADYFDVSMDYLLGNVWNPKHVLSESSALGVTAYTVLPDDVQADEKEIIFGNGPHKYVRTEEEIQHMKHTARPRISIFEIGDYQGFFKKLSDSELIALIAEASNTLRERQENNPPSRPQHLQSPPAPQEGTDTTPPPEGAEGPQDGE